MRAAAFAAAVLSLTAACDPTVIKASCTDLTPQELNQAESCLGPPVTDTGGLQVCGVGSSDVPVCLVGPDARIYRAHVGFSAAIRGDGWTHSSYGTVPSTLSPADLARCAKVLPSDGGTIPACP